LLSGTGSEGDQTGKNPLHGIDAQGVWAWIDNYHRDCPPGYFEQVSSPADTSAMETSVGAAAYRLTQGWRDTPLIVGRAIACWPLAGPSPAGDPHALDRRDAASDIATGTDAPILNQRRSL
jgi:hypothetical protein